jgi:putative glutamine amidotransferase
MSLPIIAVSVELLDAPHYEGVKRCQLFHPYLECLREARLIPMLVAPDSSVDELEVLLANVDGVLLSGGDDIDLSLNGGPTPLKECKPIPAAQQESVLAMINIAKKRDMPLLGICLGMQSIGIAHGSVLEQHLPQHKMHTKGIEHTVSVCGSGILRDTLGSEPFTILSYHHQGISLVNPPLKMVAKADDGTIEAIEHPDFNYLVGVQWHPEKTPQSAASRDLFASFASAVNQYRASRV